MPRIFGREPALWLALVAILIKAASAFWFHADDHTQALVNAAAAAVIGLVVAAMTGNGVVAAILGFVQAAVALMVGFGFHITADSQALIMSLAAAIIAMFTRTQVTPTARPAPRAVRSAAP